MYLSHLGIHPDILTQNNAKEIMCLPLIEEGLKDCYSPLIQLSSLTSACLRIITQGNLNDIHDERILGNYFDFVNVMLVL